MLIHNYGLFWRREFIHWGSQGNIKNPGHLKGVINRGNQDAKDASDFAEQRGVYALYDDGFKLVYVGQAGGKNQQRLFKRLANHRNDQLADRWSKFSWFGITPITKITKRLKSEKGTAHAEVSAVIDHIEAILIAIAEPPTNRQGGRFGDTVEQYHQFRDTSALPLDQAKMVEEIWRAWGPGNG